MGCIDDVINYYLNHPPVDVSDPIAYQELLNIVVRMTTHEISENFPIIEEKSFTTGPPANPDDTFVFVDLYTDIDSRFMDFIVLFEKNNPPPKLSDFMYRWYGYGFGRFDNRCRASLMNLIANREATQILQDWFSKQIEKLIFQGSKIKLKPNTEYYCIYRRYRDTSELPDSVCDVFKRLIEVNLLLEFYQSNVLASESEIRSVSISGLSVTFNVPTADTRTTVVMRLRQEKENLLTQLALDYGDGEVGLIY